MIQNENPLIQDGKVKKASFYIAQALAVLLLGDEGISDDAQGMASFDTNEAVPEKAEAENADADVSQDNSKAAKKATAEAPVARTAGSDGVAIKRSDVERAMAAKIKALAAQGTGPGVIGQIFPKFNGAQCVSDLTEDDYPAFLAELSEL